eukprot:1176912-Prorocentrum_minimum.AAC.1
MASGISKELTCSNMGWTATVRFKDTDELASLLSTQIFELSEANSTNAQKKRPPATQFGRI